jgi:hypothetical protein
LPALKEAKRAIDLKTCLRLKSPGNLVKRLSEIIRRGNLNLMLADGTATRTGTGHAY